MTKFRSSKTNKKSFILKQSRPYVNKYPNTSGRLITERPEFFISLAAMIIGLQFFLAGFLGEIILRTRKRKDNYIIKEEIKRS